MEEVRWCLEVNEDLGEVICDECDGKGWRHHEMVDYSTIQGGVPESCKKCQGTGKLDWIERIVGKRPRKLSAYFNCFGISDILDIKIPQDELVRRVAEQIAADIDREIIETLMIPKEVLGVK